MTIQEQRDLLDLTRRNLVSLHSRVKYKFNDVDFTQDMGYCIDMLGELLKEFDNGSRDAATEIAVQYMKNQPQAGADKVSEFVRELMVTITTI